MNKENLLRMADHIETIPQKEFDMEKYRKDGSSLEMECNSVGCAVGHCSILDIDNIQKNFICMFYWGINFLEWSEQFTGVYVMPQWNYLFGDRWKYIDNTPQGTANRIRYIVKHGFPNLMSIEEEINGTKKLSYE
jgi:hypothetical protein